MARTPSTMLELGTQLPAFDLPIANGEGGRLSSAALQGAPALIMFICNHCPFVIHLRAALAALGRDYPAGGIQVIAINSNDVERYPQDSPERMKAESVAAGYRFPYLFDEDQSVALAFKAACTPDFYLFDAEGRLVYRGQLDGARPGNDVPVTGADLRAAMDALLSGAPISADQRPSLGCNIKWKPGNEPDQ
ncbi:thioredoxin family protein [Myxococcota bacterium]|nr:thioredoxin family protein [Myxococcota bacterium]MBU1899574.1 thioredoxin family protein [Myxococcota bacterium]